MHAISLKGISKRYRLYPRHRDRLREVLSLGRNRHGHDFWALEDVTLDVEPGTSVGLLGRNGAGKSTLLQVISGVLQPTRGTVHTRGRISALLQLGAGFNPEFTGRENALMNGLLLGIDRREMLERFDEIEAFADIGEFMDQPVKNYSSGMRARLGFAVAVNVEPDILLVDETLSVGDGVFRHMGILKMRELRDSGATIVFVSHSTNMIKNFCTEAVLLHHGNLVARGDTSETVDYYQALLSNAATQREDGKSDSAPSDEDELGIPDFKQEPGLEDSGRLRYGTGEAKIQGVELLNEHGKPADFVTPDTPFIVRVHVQYQETVNDSVVNIILRNRSGLDIFSTNTTLEMTPIRRRTAGDRIIVDFKLEALLKHDLYSVATGVTRSTKKDAHLDWVDVAATFEMGKPMNRGAYAGIVHLPTKVTIFEPEKARDSERSA